MWNEKTGQPTTEQAQPPLAKPTAAPSASDERRGVAWIGQSVVFKGELISAEDMRIEGRVEGTIELRNHDLVIGTNAKIQADIVAKTITVRGTVSGTMTASDRIDVRETASVEGDISAPRLSMADGATVKGRVSTGPKQAEAETTRPGLAMVN